MNYNGGKNGSGVYQKIISMMPKHSVYIEGFLGSGAILRYKKPASYQSYGIEIDKEVLAQFKPDREIKGLYFYNESFLTYVKRTNLPNDTLIYLDPPYLKSVRKSKNKLYKFEFWTEEEHRELLTAVLNLKCYVMISGYDSTLYNEMLSTWRKESFTTSNRAGQKTTEIVWLNFPEPMELHDYRYLGSNFTERQQIKRKKARWKNRLLKLDTLERFALMEMIDELKNPSSHSQI